MDLATPLALEETRISLASARRVPLFSELDGDELSELLGGLRPVSFRKGEDLITQGDGPDGAYFLENGGVDVITVTPGGGETQIAVLEAGNMIGDLGLIDDAARTASVRARSDASGMFLNRTFFQGAVAQRRDCALKILRRILRLQCQRQSSLNEQIAAGDEPAFIASKCGRFLGEL